MVGSSKVLTVSYGTFSCTLEGFDDSFDTMKAIAEYFRDLAADDRYFGAEPPTPDAEMLARIAEREIARRVDARMSDGGVYLRAADATMPRQAEIKAEPTPEPVPIMPTQADPAPNPAPAAPKAEAMREMVRRTAPASTESVAAKLQRIRAVVGKSAAASSEFIEDLPQSHEPFEFNNDAELIEDISDEPAPAIEDVQAFEAVVEPAEEIVEEFEDILTDEDFEDESETFDEPKVAAEADEPEVEATLAEDDFETEPAVAPKRPIFAFEYPSGVTNHPDLTADAEEEEDEDEEDTLAEEEESQVDIQAARNRVRLLRREHAAQVDDDEVDEDDEPAESIFAEDDEEKRDNFEDDLDDAAQLDEPSVNLADLDGLDEFSDEGASLSDEEEAEFLRELSQDNALDDEEDAEEKQPASRRAGRAYFETAPEQDDAAMARILNKADAKLSEPETNRRREAISHLKAAVAATEAARQLGEAQETPEGRESPFRKVLNQVVRPRPAPTVAEEDRTERSRPAPLKLVASQRVDVKEPEAEKEPAVAQPTRTVMPRRISTQFGALRKPDPNEAVDPHSFAAFAQSSGASDLGELLEAAAAYTAYIEGLEDFSRPQIMRKVMEVETFNREDSLRSFGTLLREGRIEKVRNGRFQVSEDTRYRPSA